MRFFESKGSKKRRIIAKRAELANKVWDKSDRHEGRDDDHGC